MCMLNSIPLTFIVVVFMKKKIEKNNHHRFGGFYFTTNCAHLFPSENIIDLQDS